MIYFQVVPAWLNCLPIKGDLIEAKAVHDQLCSMVERQVDRYLIWFIEKVIFVSFANYPCHLLQLVQQLYDLSSCRSDMELLGPNNQYLPKIVSVFAEVRSLPFYLTDYQDMCILIWKN